MTIKIASKNDLHVLLSLGKKLHDVEKVFEPLLVFSPIEAKRRYTQELNNPHALFLLAEVDDKPAGYLYAHLDKVDYLATNKNECEIEVVFVESIFRGQGIAHELVERCLEWAQTKNVLRVTAGIFAQNTSSQSAFLKLGFKPHHITYIH